jgi:hypothetical protein
MNSREKQISTNSNKFTHFMTRTTRIKCHLQIILLDSLNKDFCVLFVDKLTFKVYLLLILLLLDLVVLLLFYWSHQQIWIHWSATIVSTESCRNKERKNQVRLHRCCHEIKLQKLSQNDWVNLCLMINVSHRPVGTQLCLMRWQDDNNTISWR